MPALTVRSRATLLLLGAALLSGCSGSPSTEEPAAISPGPDAVSETFDPPAPTADDEQDASVDAAPSTGPAADDAAKTSEPPAESESDEGDSRPGLPGEVSAQVQADGTIVVDGSQASFLMPSQNVACLVLPDNVVCQIDGKNYDARSGDIDPAAFEGCTPAEADAMSVGGGIDPRWSCLPYDLRPGTDVTSGGAWSGAGIGASTTLDGATVAVLPYGDTLRLGNISCTSDRLGVRCTDLTTGHGFQLASGRYTTH